MARDWIVTLCCIFIIVCLGFNFNFDFDTGFTLKKEVSVSDVVGMLSAVAAAIAAWAAWNAATIAKASAEDNNAFARAQLYISHRADFVELLDYVGKELGVIFYQKNELYSKLFPLNHYSGEVFDSKGSDAVFSSWNNQYLKIVNRTEIGLNDLELYNWINDCIDISYEMKFESEKPKAAQICFWAYTDQPSVTGFVSSPARNIFNISEVMNRLRNFCGRERVGECLLEGHPFEAHFKLFYDRINEGHDDHCVGIPGEPIVPKPRNP